MKSNDYLKREREIRGWSQARLAQEIGTTAVNIGRWERGASIPSPYFRERLCITFGKDAQALGLVPKDEEHSLLGTTKSFFSPYSANPTTGIFDPAIPVPKQEREELVGRQTLLRQMQQAICAEGNSPARVLHGLPGVGKTTLAVALANDADVRTHFSDGILWAGLGPKPNLLQHLNRWGALLGIPLKDVTRSHAPEIWTTIIRTAIGLRRMLIVIDDAWELEASFVCKVGGSRCAYIVTTRCPQLAVSFARNGAIKVPELNEKEGVTLLRSLASPIVKYASDSVRALCKAAGGLPLALTIMGKYLQVQAYSNQPRRLQNALEQLQIPEYRLHVGEPHIIPEYHPNLPLGATVSLQSVIAVSDQRLDNAARLALQALSVFPPKPNSFSEESAMAVSAASVETLDALYDIGLLECSSPGRYTLHQTIADYARISCNDAARYTLYQKRLVTHIIDYVKRQKQNIEALEEETENILAALDLAYQQGWSDELIEGLCSLMPFLSFRNLYTQAEAQLQRAREVAKSANDPRSLARILYHQGDIALKQGMCTRAEACYREGLGLAQETHSQEMISFFLRGLGNVARIQRDYAQAESVLAEGLELARQFNADEHLCLLLLDFGLLLTLRQKYTQAEKCLLEALTLARSLEQHELISVALTSLGRVAIEQENYAQAEAWLLEGLTIASRLDHHERMSHLLTNLGMIAMRQGDNRQAETYLQEGQALTHGRHQRAHYCSLLLQWGELSLKLQRHETAAAAFHEALTAMPEGNSELCAHTYYGLARVSAAEGNLSTAREWGQKSMRIFEELDHPHVSLVKQWIETCALPKTVEEQQR